MSYEPPIHDPRHDEEFYAHLESINMTQTKHLQLIRARCVELLENHRDNGIDKYTEPAEAGWLATIAAVDAFFKLDSVTYGWDGDCGATCIADALADSIISAWPIELLNNK